MACGLKVSIRKSIGNPRCFFRWTAQGADSERRLNHTQQDSLDADDDGADGQQQAAAGFFHDVAPGVITIAGSTWFVQDAGSAACIGR